MHQQPILTDGVTVGKKCQMKMNENQPYLSAVNDNQGTIQNIL